MKKIVAVCTVLLCLVFTAQAQEADTLAAYNADELFSKGREAAFAGDREKGRVYLLKALEKIPGYTEVRIFTSRTYLWDDQPEKAKDLLKPLLDTQPDHLEAIKVMFDAAWWNDDSETALQWAEKGLRNNASDKELLTKKAQALGGLKRFDEALATLDVVLMRNPGDKAAGELLNSFKVARRVNALTVSADYDFFTKTFGNASLYSLQYSRRTSLGSIIARVNESNRFGTIGWQAEIDAYPSITKGVYTYLNYGFSPTSLFPEHRAGGELYVSLPKAFESSAGFRYLYFSEAINVLMYTGTVGKYYKNLWFSARVFLTPGAGISSSLGLQVRRYFADPNHFIGLSGSYGFSPDFRNLQSNDGLSTTEIYKLKACRVGASYQKPVSTRWVLAADTGYSRQELLFDMGEFVGIWSVGLRARYSF